MLQQTRVAAALPYYERFLARFPDAATLAAAPEPDLLAAWAGLGYYARARNLQKAARRVVEQNGFPRNYAELRELPGVGDYTAAAVASIAFGLPHAVLDGNVVRVLCRLLNETGEVGSVKTRRRLQAAADGLLDRRDPAQFNQALMELGATICLPRQPKCLFCPVVSDCEARRLGRQSELPVKAKAKRTIRIEKTVLVIRKRGRFLLRQRPPASRRMPGFWDLPEPAELPQAVSDAPIGSFRHSVTHHNYVFTVCTASIEAAPKGFQWIFAKSLHNFALSTTAKKALRCLTVHEGRPASPKNPN